MTETTFDIQGMTCNHCVSVVERALLEVAGVHCAEVSLEQNQATVGFDSDLASLEELTSAVQEAGFEASEVALESPGLSAQERRPPPPPRAAPRQPDLAPTWPPRIGSSPRR